MLAQWRDRWTAAGVPTIPLRPNSKRALCAAWNLTPTPEQWAEANGRACNIGALMGNGLVAVDCDAPATVEAVRAALDGMGLRWPEVQTQSGGRHYYGRCADAPDWFNWSTLAREVGPGELRARNAYLVAPCSEVDGRPWRFVAGAPESLPKLRPIAWRDLAWLLDAQNATAQAAPGNLEHPPLRLVWRPMPERVRALLRASALTRGPSRPFEGYASRSEAEYGAVAGLILSAWSFDEIRATFDELQPGHYRDAPNREQWLARAYESALGWLASTPERMTIADAYRAAELAPWPGRGGGLERAVYLGLLADCWRWGAWEVRASVRCLAQHAAASVDGAHNALTRLERAGKISRVKGWAWDTDTTQAEATAWQVHLDRTVTTRNLYLQDLEPLSVLCALSGAEVWSPVALGRSAQAVYRLLGAQPVGVTELARLTGKHRNTIARALVNLRGCGLAEEHDGGWVRGARDLAEIADATNALERGLLRRARHDRQRRAWRRAIELSKEKQGEAGAKRTARREAPVCETS